MGRRKNYKTWTTEDEIAFVDSLGEHGYGGAEPYCDLLEKYLQAAKDRTDWGQINRDAVIEYVKARVMNCIMRGEQDLPRCRCSYPHAYNVGVV